jgi:hypothetical protein
LDVIFYRFRPLAKLRFAPKVLLGYGTFRHLGIHCGTINITLIIPELAQELQVPLYMRITVPSFFLHFAFVTVPAV